MAVFFYNGTVKDKEQAQDIADLTAKTESLEKQQDQILTALKETYEKQKTAAESNASSDVSSEADNKSEKDSAEDLSLIHIFRGDFNTAGSTMFLLGIGEILEEWTHKKSVNDLARSMSINAEKVWFVNEDGQEVLISASSVKAGDLIRVHMGNVIPFDGDVAAGEAMVNQTSLTDVYKRQVPIHL